MTAVTLPKGNLVFYFPFPTVGGVSILFIRLAKVLKEHWSVVLMDHPDGYMAQNLPEGVEFLSIFDKSSLQPDSILILQGCHPWRIANFEDFPGTIRVLFWHLHPDNFFPYVFYGWRKRFPHRLLHLFFSSNRLRRGKSFVVKLLARDSLFFMDMPNVRGVEAHLGINIESPEKRILRISTDKAEGSGTTTFSHEKLRLAWLGRVEDFKTSILLHTLERLDKISCPKSKFVIIGSGKDLKIVENFSKSLNNLEVLMMGEVDFQQICETLSDVDVLFAMGTSALEGARFRVPTILTDFSYDQIEGFYRYEMIYQKEGYSLGERIDHSHLEDTCSLGSLLEDIALNPNLYASRCHEYWKEFFSPSVFVSEFDSVVEKTKMTCKDIVDCGDHLADWPTKMLYKMRACQGRYNPKPGWQY